MKYTWIPFTYRLILLKQSSKGDINDQSNIYAIFFLKTFNTIGCSYRISHLAFSGFGMYLQDVKILHFLSVLRFTCKICLVLYRLNYRQYMYLEGSVTNGSFPFGITKTPNSELKWSDSINALRETYSKAFVLYGRQCFHYTNIVPKLIM